MSYSCNDNQNYFVSADRTTSRVLNPPGGASSFSLGLPEQPKTNEQPKKETAGPPRSSNQEPSASVSANRATAPSPRVEVVVAAAAAAVETAAPSAAVVAPTVLSTAAPSSPPSPFVPGGAFAAGSGTVPVSSNAFASGANMNGANVLTGRPTSRVLAPPGGHSASGGSLW